MKQNAKIQDLTPMIKYLFWWAPEKEMREELQELSGTEKKPVMP
jgi:hypothetical protein